MDQENNQNITQTAVEIGEKLSSKISDIIEKHPKPKTGRIIAGHISKLVSKLLSKRRQDKKESKKDIKYES
jgi:predicted nuclease with RNAse H fold